MTSGKQAIAAATSSNDTDVNSVNDGPSGTGRYVGGDDAEVVDRIRSTYAYEGYINPSHGVAQGGPIFL